MTTPTCPPDDLLTRVDYWRREIAALEVQTERVTAESPGYLSAHLSTIASFKRILASEERAWALCFLGREGALAHVSKQADYARLMEYLFRVTE